MNVNLRKFTLLFTACLLLCGLGSPGAFGQPPSLINFRGQLLDNGGQSVTASVAVELRIFSAGTGGTELYLEDMGYIEVRGGQYAFQFGANGNPDLASVIQGNAEAWVEVTVDNNALPRQRFVSVPYALNAGSAQIASGAVTRDMLSPEILDDLNRTQISNGSITREMLAQDLLDNFKTTLDSLYLPPSSSGMPLVGDSNFTVPEGKVLAITYIGKSQFSASTLRVLNQNLAWNHYLGTGVRLLDENTSFVLGESWQNNYNSGVTEDKTASFVGIMYEKTTAFLPVIGPELGSSSNYTVPNGKNLVITSLSAGGLDLNSKLIYRVNRGYAEDNNIPIILPSDTTFKLLDGPFGFSGYLIDENRSLGGGLISSTDQKSSVTPSMLSDSILKYLRPEIVQEPSFTGTIRNGTSVELNPEVEGKYVTYQWYKDGEPIDEATSQLFSIDNFDVGYHDGNYTVVASNDFGDIESAVIELAGKNNDFRGVDISSMNFEGQDLSDALFDSSTIFSNGSIGANFSGTGVKLDNLFGDIDLRGVNLHGADLRGSDLSRAQFNEQTFITAANLSGTGAVFPDSNFDLTGANVAGVDFSQSYELIISSDTVLTESDGSNGLVSGANLHAGTGGSMIVWNGVPNNFRGVNITGINFEGQDLSDALFDSSTIFSNGSIGAIFSGTGVKLDNLFGDIDLRGVNLHGADLRGSDLSRAQFNEQTFITAANLSGTGAVFPAGTFDLNGSNVAGVDFSESNNLTISYDTILTEYDEGLGRYVGADIAFNNVGWGGVPNDLRGVNIAGVGFVGQDLSAVQFDSSTIFSSDVLGYSAGASLSAEDSSKGANLNLHGNVDLRGVNLYHANLTGSDLREANLNNGTILHANNLTRVNLCGVDLASAQFGDYASSHTYDQTYYNSATIFPEGFNPNDYPGLVLVEDTFTVEGGQGSAPFFLISNGQGTVDFTTYQLHPGSTYAFRSWEISQEHSFMIGESYGDMESSMVYRGPLTRENEGSLMFLTIPSGFDGSLYYFCPLHTNMVQEFNVRRPNHTADLNATVDMEMIWVQPGSFMMGQDGLATPEHNVTLTNGFYLGKYEVTQAQYEAVMTGNSDGLSATPSNWPNNADRPVEQVSWDDIQKFLTRLNAQESGNIPAGWSYVLPTEAQWEYACRAGTTTAYSWGVDINSSNANYNNNIGQTADVGQYSANPWGFFDMHGNVNEWTADWYGGYSYGAQTDPEGPASGSLRVNRGGPWLYAGTSLRSARRSSNNPSTRTSYIGFRVGFQQLAADVASPEMSILGDANITQLQGVAWVDPGVEAHDVRDGNLTSSVSVSGTVDVNTTGTYTLTYTVSDAAGNQASLTRTVTVVAGQASTHTADLNASVSMEMIWVQPGSFMMGSPTTEAGRNANEIQHEVTLTNGFYLGKYEVTQAQYEAVMTGNSDGLSATPSEWPNNADRPVEKVSWDDIQKFLTRLNAQESGNIPAGWSYVLPTEAQWGYACRAGTTTAYSWGDDINSSRANYNWDGAYNTGIDFKQTRDVGQYSANPWGFFDMHGNVWEWTADWYGGYSSGAQTDPEGSASGSARVIRGGSWISSGPTLRSAIRHYNDPSSRYSYIGFRVGFQEQLAADVASPEMSILGDANITQLQGVAWVDPGVEAHDVRDGNLTSSVSVSGTVDVNTTGTYTLTYTVSDAAGNQASLTRTVTVVAGQASTHTADLNASVSMEMIWVEPGSFTMGQSDISNASPEHNVTLTKGFYLGKYEVTQAQYEAVMTGNSDGLSATPSEWPNIADRPVEKVSWDDIQKFLTRLNAQESGNIPAGWSYVLPTEAQWEYACRAGTTTAYSWGVDINSSNANYNNNIGQTADVGQYSANPWGFFDMHGNVWEWTADWYGGYSSGAQTDPEGSAAGSARVLRGGSWHYPGSSLRSASRNSTNPSNRLNSIGFRVGFQQQ